MINNRNTIENTKTKRMTLPVTVRNINEAKRLCKDFKSVLTVGPERYEVSDFNHDDHKVITFNDVTLTIDGGPTIWDIKEAIEWGTNRDNILVHCHAGMSRSTATAWGICISHGLDPYESLKTLSANHPKELNSKGKIAKRAFIPNELIVMHLEKLFGHKYGTLLRIRDEFEHWEY